MRFLLVLLLVLGGEAIRVKVDFESPPGLRQHLSFDQLSVLDSLNAKRDVECTIIAYTYTCRTEPDQRVVRVSSLAKDVHVNHFDFVFRRDNVKVLFVQPDFRLAQDSVQCTVYTWELYTEESLLHSVDHSTYLTVGTLPATFYAEKRRDVYRDALEAMRSEVPVFLSSDTLDYFRHSTLRETLIIVGVLTLIILVACYFYDKK